MGTFNLCSFLSYDKCLFTSTIKLTSTQKNSLHTRFLMQFNDVAHTNDVYDDKSHELRRHARLKAWKISVERVECRALLLCEVGWSSC